VGSGDKVDAVPLADLQRRIQGVIMYDIIQADGKIEASETKAINELKEIIDLVVDK
jgi:uncharacterized tellurite resistance protein B-like protein